MQKEYFATMCMDKNFLETPECNDQFILHYRSGISLAYKIILKQTKISEQLGEEQKNSVSV
jgi:hypothetical protein